jgi:hypothetical protein
MSGFTKWFISDLTPGFGSFDSTYDFITDKAGFVNSVLIPVLVDGTAPSQLLTVKLLSDTQIEVTTDGSYSYQLWSCLLISGESTYSDINQEYRVYQVVDSTTYRLELSEGITSLTLASQTTVSSTATIKVAPIGWDLVYSDTVSSTNAWIFGTKVGVDMQLFFKLTNSGTGYLKLDSVGPSYTSGGIIDNAYTATYNQANYNDLAFINPYSFDGYVKKYFFIGNEEGFYNGMTNCSTGDVFNYIGRLSTMFNEQNQTKYYWAGFPAYSRYYYYGSSYTNRYWSAFPRCMTSNSQDYGYGTAILWTNLYVPYLLNTNYTSTNMNFDTTGPFDSTIIFKDVPSRLEVNKSYLLYPGMVDHISIKVNSTPTIDTSGKMIDDGDDLYWSTSSPVAQASYNNYNTFVIDLKNKWNQSRGFISSVPSFT